MKSASRSKLLHCFRPMDAAIEAESEPETNLGSNHLIVEKPIHYEEDYSKAVSEKKRTLSRVVKAVFFETILAKRARDKTKSCGFSKSKELRSRIITSSSTSSSSLSTSIPESAKRKYQETNYNEGDSNIAEKKIKDETIINHHHHNMGLYYLLLISLAITVLCGRFLAILLTSIWLCVVFAGERARKSRRREKRKGHNYGGLT